MKQTTRLFHPVLIFIFSIVALGLSLFLYIYWYVGVSTRLQTLIRRFNLDSEQFFDFNTWVVIVVLSILVGIILVGIFIIFVFSVKTQQLYRRQHNFINSFTHELKTPVTSLQLYTETFKKHELPRDMQLRYIDFMLADLGRLTANINRILGLARIESGIHEGKFVVADLVATMEEFCARNRELFRNSNIRIHNPSNGPFPYPVDLAMFEMLIMNLLTNAVKYNESERPSVDITFMPRNQELHILFKDNGMGFSRREGKRIFKKFYQIERPRQPQGEGSGLGLYLVDVIARVHKGKVIAESEGDGKGATITLILPQKQEGYAKGAEHEEADTYHRR